MMAGPVKARGPTLALERRPNDGHELQEEAHMLKGLAKLVAYRKAPKRTFALLHPIRAVKWGLGLLLAKKLIDGFRSDSA